MMPFRTTWSFIRSVDSCRPRFFFKREWRWHVLMMPLLLLVGNFYFIGSLYFRNLLTFIAGTTLAFVLYWLSVVVLTLAVRWTIRRYPGMRQTVPRTLVMLTIMGSITLGLSVFLCVGV